MFILRPYYLDALPPVVSEDEMSMHLQFEEHGFLKIQSVSKLVDLLFEDMRFVNYAALGTDPEDTMELPFVAFEILLESYPDGMLKPNQNGVVSAKDAALQLMFNEQNPNPIPDHDYTLAYPDTNISSSGDIVILYDAEKARIAFEAWLEGLPFVDDLETKTYRLNEETGEYELQPAFDNDMA